MILRKLICGLILLSTKTPSIKDKIIYYLSIVMTFAPIVTLCDLFSLWFTSNKRFATFIVISLLLNMFVGVWVHRRFNSFTWEDFIIKNAYMAILIFICYIVLEMIRVSAGENFVTLAFKSVVEVSTLLYPCSKILKNLYILSNKTIPHPFIMERLYKFEKTGKLDDIFKPIDEQKEITNP